MNFSCLYKSPAGDIIIESDGKRITSLKFCDEPANKESETKSKKTPEILSLTISWLDRYFSGIDPGETPELSPSGTDFQKAVWKKVSGIPYGKTVTYGEIAARLFSETGKKTSARAVGRAVGKNPVLILLPCHRVVGAGKKITGYSAGINKKIFLLTLEKGI